MKKRMCVWFVAAGLLYFSKQMCYNFISMQSWRSIAMEENT